MSLETIGLSTCQIDEETVEVRGTAPAVVVGCTDVDLLDALHWETYQLYSYVLDCIEKDLVPNTISAEVYNERLRGFLTEIAGCSIAWLEASAQRSWPEDEA